MHIYENEKFFALTRFETEAQENSEMGYSFYIPLSNELKIFV